jgi:hypothetical protein
MKANFYISLILPLFCCQPVRSIESASPRKEMRLMRLSPNEKDLILKEMYKRNKFYIGDTSIMEQYQFKALIVDKKNNGFYLIDNYRHLGQISVFRSAGKISILRLGLTPQTCLDSAQAAIRLHRRGIDKKTVQLIENHFIKICK